MNSLQVLKAKIDRSASRQIPAGADWGAAIFDACIPNNNNNPFALPDPDNVVALVGVAHASASDKANQDPNGLRLISTVASLGLGESMQDIVLAFDRDYGLVAQQVFLAANTNTASLKVVQASEEVAAAAEPHRGDMSNVASVKATHRPLELKNDAE